MCLTLGFVYTVDERKKIDGLHAKTFMKELVWLKCDNDGHFEHDWLLQPWCPNDLQLVLK